MNMSTKKLAYASVIAAAYASLTMVLAPISYGTLQLRLSETLCILPFFFPPAAGGLFVGCVISNLMSSAGALDIVFGSLASLLAGICTAAVGKKYRNSFDAPACEIKKGSDWGACIAACSMPVLFNAPIVGAVLSYAFSKDAFWQGFLLFGAQVGAGEAIVMFALGLPLMRFALKDKSIQKFFRELS